MKKYRDLIKTVLFFAGFFIILYCLNFCFAQVGYVKYIVTEAEKESNNYDTVILGASHTRASVNPEILDKRLGTNSINMAIPGETVEDSYYILKEISRYNDIKTVILDCDYQYWVWEQPTKHFSKPFIYQNLNNFDVKCEYIANNLNNTDVRNFITNRLSWNCSISFAKENIKKKLSAEYKNNDISIAYSANGGVEGADGPYVGKGYFFRMGTGKGNNPGGEDYLKTWVNRYDNEFDQRIIGFYDKITEYCKDNNIDLICITSPITPTSVRRLQMDKVHNRMKSAINKNGIEYYDFNKALMSEVPRTDSDYGDREGHVGGEVGNIFSTTLADMLFDRKNGNLDESKYFYSTFEECYSKCIFDYERETNKKWEAYK